MSAILFQITIPGRAYCKKNTQRVVGFGKSKRAIYSPQYISWEKTAMLTIRQNKKPISAIGFPVNMKAIFYFENHSAEADLSALYEGIQDVLEKEEIILNDRLILGHNGSTKIFGEKPRVEVELTAFTMKETA